MSDILDAVLEEIRELPTDGQPQRFWALHLNPDDVLDLMKDWRSWVGRHGLFLMGWPVAPDPEIPRGVCEARLR